jgi:hypothetical protein
LACRLARKQLALPDALDYQLTPVPEYDSNRPQPMAPRQAECPGHHKRRRTVVVARHE